MQQEESASKKRKASDIVACTECRTRKTKCNRQFPCDSCTKRGTPWECTPEIRKYPPSLSGLSNTVEALQERVDRLEKLLAGQQQQPPRNDSDRSEEDGAGNNLSSSANGVNGAADNPFNNFSAATKEASAPIVASRASNPASNVLRGVKAATPATQVALSHLLSGQTATKDFDILNATEKPSSGPVIRYTSSISSYPSIRASVLPPPTSWQSSLLLALHAHLPPMASIRSTLQLFMDYCKWSALFINCAQLLAEVDEMDHLLQQGLYQQIDPAWLALLFQVMASGLITAYTCGHGLSYPYQGRELKDPAERFLEASEGAMAAASWADTARIRIIQTLILRVRWADYFDPDSGLLVRGPKGQSVRAAVALAHAEALSLNALGSDRSVMPQADLALPAHACDFRRQMGLRIWTSLRLLYLTNGIEPDLASDTVDPDPLRDSDLSFGFAGPSESPPDWETIFQRFHIATCIDLSAGLGAAQASRAELLALEVQCHTRMSSFKAMVRSLPSEGCSAYWKDQDGFLSALHIFEWGMRLRLRRAAFGAADASGATESLYLSAVEAAITLAQAITHESAARLVRIIPAIVLYLLNAAVTLSVAVKTTGPMHGDTDLTNLLTLATRTLSTHGRSALNTAIATNAQKAIDALFRLVRRLAKSPDTTVMASGDSHLVNVLRDLAEVSNSPEAVAVFMETSTFANPLDISHPQPQSQYQTPNFETLALLDGLDFVKWTEGLLDDWTDPNGS